MYSRQLLDENVRARLTEGDVRQLVATVKEELDDDELIEKLRQVRNVFAQGGSDLAFDSNEFGIDCLVKMINPLMVNFVETSWMDGLKLLFQIIFNSTPFFAQDKASFIELYFTSDKMGQFLEMLTKCSDKSQPVSCLVCACLYNELRLDKTIVNSQELVLHCLRHCLNDRGEYNFDLLEGHAADPEWVQILTQ